ncbi:hypothetical protein M0802_016716 [Mischocyttarus mexicanus]|nr:hypothetical protein M0802_016716 [Mischocyttarus mexicanus]
MYVGGKTLTLLLQLVTVLDQYLNRKCTMVELPVIITWLLSISRQDQIGLQNSKKLSSEEDTFFQVCTVVKQWPYKTAENGSCS